MSLFLICFIHGLERSYQKNGLKGFWKKQLLATCLSFGIAKLLARQSFTPK